MDGTLDEDPAPSLLLGSKAGRNERRKLMATLANNLCAALIIAALLQPALTFFRQERPITSTDVIVALVFGVTGIMLHAIGQTIAARLED